MFCLHEILEYQIKKDVRFMENKADSSLKMYDELYKDFLGNGDEKIREQISDCGGKLLDEAEALYSLNYEERHEKIVVSLTTIPSRLHAVVYPIKCMLVQTMRPDKIILWLGENVKDSMLSKELLALKQYGLEIRYVEDVGPHTKYYYALQEYKDSLVITIDDDVFYRRDLVEELYKTHMTNPGCVCAFWIWKMKFTYNGIPYPYKKYYLGYGDVDLEPSHKLIALGVGGVLYPKACLDERAFDLDSLKRISLKNDDIWLKAMEIINDVKVARVPGNNFYQPTVENTQDIALLIDNNDWGNDRWIKNVFKEFRLSEYFRGE